MTYVFEETTTLETDSQLMYHHNRKQYGNYIAITDTKVTFETDSDHPNVGGIREVKQFREGYEVEYGVERLITSKCYTIDASTPEGMEAARIVFELLLNTPTDFWN